MIELTGTSPPARKVMAHIRMTGHAGIVQTMRPGNDRLLLRSASRRQPVDTGSGAVRLVEGLCGLVVGVNYHSLKAVACNYDNVVSHLAG